MQLFQLLRELRSTRSFRLSAALFNGGELEQRLRDLGIHVEILDEQRLGPISLLRQLARTLRELKPSIVHTHGFKENVIGSMAAFLARTPHCVRTLHGATEIRLKQWEIKKRTAHAFDSFVGSHLQQGAVIVSEALAQQVKARGDYEFVWTIKNGIDPRDVRTQAALGAKLPPTSRRRVGIIARLVPIKRIDLFLQTASELLASGSDAEFFVIGEGPLRRDLEALASSLGVSQKVSFLGFRPDAVSLMSQMDAVMFTSDSEGTPMAALEALALGVPLVARAVGGLPELIADASQGRLVHGDSPRELASALVETLERSGERHGQSLLPKDYDIAHTAERYAEVYEQLMLAPARA